MSREESFKASVCELLALLKNVKHEFGTITDINAIATYYTENPESDFTIVTDYDCAKLKFVVDRGILKSAWFRPPFGYKVLGFLTALKDTQERQRAAIFNAKDKELIDLIAERLYTFFEKHNGSAELAKKEMKDTFKNHNEYTRHVFNQAYTIAKHKWETHATTN